MRAAWPPAPPRVLTWLRFQRAKDWQVFAFRIGTDWITGPVPDSGTEWHVSTTGSAEVSPEMGVHFCSTRLGVYLQHFRLTLTVASEWSSTLKVVRGTTKNYAQSVRHESMLWAMSTVCLGTLSRHFLPRYT